VLFKHFPGKKRNESTLGRVHNLCRGVGGEAMAIFIGGHDFFLSGFRGGAIENFSRYERRYNRGGHPKKFHKNRHHQFTHT